MKKLLVVFASIIAISASTTSVFAHGSHHGGAKSANYSVCATKDCTQIGQHIHSGKTYTAHYYGDGHTYHSYCGLEDCVLTGYHAHDNAYYFGHTANDGHDYHHTSGGHH